MRKGSDSIKILAITRELLVGATEEAFRQHARTGLMTFDLIPLEPYPGFARLFAIEDGS